MTGVWRTASAGIRWFAALIPAKFHIAAGLTSLLTSLILVGYFAGFVPDRRAIQYEGRINLSEAMSASGSSQLERGDLNGMRRVLEFVVGRNEDLNGIELIRSLNNQVVTFGSVTDGENFDPDGIEQPPASDSLVIVPLLRSGRDWGQLRFHFAGLDARGGMAGVWDRVRSSPFGFMAFAALLGFPLFLFYLGRVLKQLDPKAAVPGRVRSALDSIAECLVVLDRRGQLVLANAAFCELSGRSTDSLIGEPIDSLQWVLDEMDDSQPRPWCHAMQTGESVHRATAAYIDTDGRRRSFLVNCSPVQGAEGQIGGVLVSMDDVTDLEEQEKALRAAMVMAEEASVAKSTFLSNMSHEIRTPLTAILGFTEVLRRGAGLQAPERERHLQTISSSGTHLLNLINDLLDLSKVESGAMEVELLETSVIDIAFDVVDVLRVKADEKNVALDVVLEGEFPETIKSDPSRLRQVVTNLVGNAIKFTERGSVQLCLGYDAQARTCRISVIDSGIGMSEEQQAKIFDAFAQADVTVTRRFGGTGLGLSISRNLAEALGGGISVESTPGEGSRFHLDIPTGDLAQVRLLTTEHIDARAPQTRLEQGSVWQFPDAEVLVVDDAAENRELLSLVLSGLGLKVQLATDGQEAVDAVAAGRFDAVLMDVQMPVMDGYEAVGVLRARGETLPVIGLTADAMHGVEERVLAAGFSHYRTKPIDIDGLSDLLATLLGGVAVARQDHQSEEALEPARARESRAAEPVTTDERRSACDAEDADTPVVSTLITGNSRFFGIVERFLPRLDEQLAKLDVCIARNDLNEVASIAHWLKGSGGSVGFSGFTRPAARLQASAHAGNLQDVVISMNEVTAYAARVKAGWDPSSSGSIETPDVDRRHGT